MRSVCFTMRLTPTACISHGARRTVWALRLVSWLRVLIGRVERGASRHPSAPGSGRRACPGSPARCWPERSGNRTAASSQQRWSCGVMSSDFAPQSPSSGVFSMVSSTPADGRSHLVGDVVGSTSRLATRLRTEATGRDARAWPCHRAVASCRHDAMATSFLPPRVPTDLATLDQAITRLVNRTKNPRTDKPKKRLLELVGAYPDAPTAAVWKAELRPIRKERQGGGGGPRVWPRRGREPRPDVLSQGRPDIETSSWSGLTPGARCSAHGGERMPPCSLRARRHPLPAMGHLETPLVLHPTRAKQGCPAYSAAAKGT
jgi:hypothetical protein